jgi:hypothetical protein
LFLPALKTVAAVFETGHSFSRSACDKETASPLSFKRTEPGDNDVHGFEPCAMLGPSLEGIPKTDDTAPGKLLLDDTPHSESLSVPRVNTTWDISLRTNQSPNIEC